MARPNGVVLYRGNGFDGTPIVAIAVFGDSSNSKTGDMLQVHILCDNGQSPYEAVKADADTAICEGCALRGIAWKLRGCYVNVATGPNSVWECYLRGGYPDYVRALHDEYFIDRKIRWGAYGEPVLIPLSLMSHICDLSSGWTGYTHHWHEARFRTYRRYLMASTHTVDECIRAVSIGWRFFKSANQHTAEDIATLRDLTPCFNCPASKEQGHRLQCKDCLACDGIPLLSLDGSQQASVWIDTHGGLGVMHTAKHIPVLN